MKPPQEKTSAKTTRKFERLAAKRKTPGEPYVLRLYIAGLNNRSRRALTNIKKVCDERLAGRYDLQVVDLYQQPEAGRQDQILAIPTLVKTLPLPLRRLLGDLSDEEKVVIALGLSSPRERARKQKR